MSTITTAFHEGDRVRVKPVKNIQPKFHGADGVISAWCHDNTYRVKLDAFSTESVFTADELARIAAPATTQEHPFCAKCDSVFGRENLTEHNGELLCEDCLPAQEQQHTATPWYEASTGNHQGLIVEEQTGRNVAVTYDKADAALIVKACNSHERLVARVKELEDAQKGMINTLKQCQFELELLPPKQLSQRKAVLTMIESVLNRAALAEVEKGESNATD